MFELEVDVTRHRCFIIGLLSLLIFATPAFSQTKGAGTVDLEYAGTVIRGAHLELESRWSSPLRYEAELRELKKDTPIAEHPGLNLSEIERIDFKRHDESRAERSEVPKSLL